MADRGYCKLYFNNTVKQELMTSLKIVAGTAGGPTNGTNFFETEILRNSVVHFIIVDNGPMNDQLPGPDYLFTPVDGRLELQHNSVWANNKINILYSKPCQC